MFSAAMLALALAMDATAAALTRGLGGRHVEGVAIVVLFGGFQAGMAGLGLLLSDASTNWLGTWKLWVAGAMLLALGGRMVWNAWNARRRPATGIDKATESVSWWELVMLAVATSVDAAVAGTTLRVFSVSAWVAIALIGGITAGCSAIGFGVGLWLRRAAGGDAFLFFDLSGGLVLMGLGVKTVFQAS
jgi:manganese efflux pump family protein